MLHMATKKKGKQVAIRLSVEDLRLLEDVKCRIIERSNGLADPKMIAILRELAGLRPPHLLIESDHAYVRQAWEHGPFLKKPKKG